MTEYYNQLEKLIRRRRTLINRKEELEEVSLEVDGAYSAILRLEGSNGSEFAIKRPQFLKRFYNDLHNGYLQKIQAVETKIKEHQQNNF